MTTTEPLRLYFVRHGETDYNARNIMQGGAINSDLNAVGQAQAAAFCKYHALTPFSAMYVSGLKRTSQTIAALAEAQDIEPIPMPTLNELSYGEVEGRDPSPEISAKVQDAYRRWDAGEDDYRITGGESPAEGLARVRIALTTLLRFHTSGRVLVCTHGRTLRIILCKLLGYDLRCMSWFPHRNTGLYVAVGGGDRFYIERFNDGAHLEC